MISCSLQMTEALFPRPLLFNVSDDRLGPLPDVYPFNADDLRAAGPEPTQRLDQNCEGARQSTRRRRCRQDVAITTMTAVITTTLQFPLDLPAIKQTITDHEITMLVLDPCKGVVPPDFKGSDDVAVRQYLEPIAQLCSDCHVTMVGLSHFGKRDSSDSGLLILGSIAWSQVARSVVSIAEDSDSGTKVLTNTKSNYATRTRSIEFTIDSALGSTPISRTPVIASAGDSVPRARRASASWAEVQVRSSRSRSPSRPATWSRRAELGTGPGRRGKRASRPRLWKSLRRPRAVR